MENCLFCKIIAGEIPATTVIETEHSLAFHDINPQAPVHILVIPKMHQENIVELNHAAPDSVAHLIADAQLAAEAAGVGDGWRFVFNNGAKAGQEVFHCHGHIIGGRELNWPPG